MRDCRSSTDTGSGRVSLLSLCLRRFFPHFTNTIKVQPLRLLPLRLSGNYRTTDAVAAHGLSAQLHRGIS